MGVFAGCIDARNMTLIKEIKCPECGNEMEFFVRDGRVIEDSICEKCGYTIYMEESAFNVMKKINFTN